MLPLITGLIGGGASLLGSMFSSNTSASNTQAQIQAQQGMQQQTESFNAEQAQINRDYQTQMSNTAYQRASADMKAAGLNPASMFGSGGAASAPSGSTASVGTPSVPVSQSKGALSGIGDAVNRGLDSAIQAKTIDRLTAQIAQSNSERINTEADTLVKEKQPARVEAETSNVQQDTTAKRLDRARQEWEAIKYLDYSSVPDSVRKTMNIGAMGAEKLGDIAAPFVSTAVRMKGLGLLKDAFTNRGSANSYRRGYDAGLGE